MARKYWNINLEEMLESGVHFGHGTRKWNPRMAPYISAKRKGIHITNMTRTARFLSEACDLLFDAASKGKQFLIVGTKNKAADSVARAAIRVRCHYVNKKWLGGMLTNWATTETRLHKFRDLAELTHFFDRRVIDGITNGVGITSLFVGESIKYVGGCRISFYLLLYSFYVLIYYFNFF